MSQVINGTWVTGPEARNVNPQSTFDTLVSRLTSLVVASQDLSSTDQKRFTEFVLAAGSLMLARTRLGPGDQKVFETALHEAVAARKNGY